MGTVRLTGSQERWTKQKQSQTKDQIENVNLFKETNKGKKYIFGVMVEENGKVHNSFTKERVCDKCRNDQGDCKSKE